MTNVEYLNIISKYGTLEKLAMTMCRAEMLRIKAGINVLYYEVSPIFSDTRIAFNIRQRMGEIIESVYDEKLENIEFPVEDLLKQYQLYMSME